MKNLSREKEEKKINHISNKKRQLFLIDFPYPPKGTALVSITRQTINKSVSK